MSRTPAALLVVALISASIVGGVACRSRGEDAAAVDAAADAAPSSDVSFLHMNSVPASSVTLDGKPVGPTPIDKMQVTPGRHVVVFSRPDNAAKRTISVDVAAGATKAVIVRLGE